MFPPPVEAGAKGTERCFTRGWPVKTLLTPSWPRPPARNHLRTRTHPHKLRGDHDISAATPGQSSGDGDCPTQQCNRNCVTSQVCHPFLSRESNLTGFDTKCFLPDNFLGGTQIKLLNKKKAMVCLEEEITETSPWNELPVSHRPAVGCYLSANCPDTAPPPPSQDRAAAEGLQSHHQLSHARARQPPCHLRLLKVAHKRGPPSSVNTS